MDFLATQFFNRVLGWDCFQDYGQCFALYALVTLSGVGIGAAHHSAALFTIWVVLRDAMAMLIIDVARHARDAAHHDNAYRIVKSLEPFLSQWKDFIFEVGKIPFLDGGMGYVFICIGWVTTGQDWTWMA